MIMHWVKAKWLNDICTYFAACGIADPTAYSWTINRDLVTCEKCLRSDQFGRKF